MDETAKFLEQLRALHDFPCAFTFKLIGESSKGFLEAALCEVEAEVPDAVPEVSSRLSKGGRHQAITLVLRVEDAETVQRLYARFHGIKGLHMLL